jgi:hypothetical protein
MGRYQYSVVRCVPEPRTGEFINVGAIAGSAEEGDWDARLVQSFRRAGRLCSAEQLGAASEFIAEVTQLFSEAEESSYALPESWLNEVWSEKRNVVQLSKPQIAVGANASEVLDFVFASQLIDLPKANRDFVSKSTLLTRLNRELKNQYLPPGQTTLERPALMVGHLRAPLDFAFGHDDHAVQITQAWSFQTGTVDDITTEGKAWGYVLQRLQDGYKAHIEGHAKSIGLDGDVPVEVLLAGPRTAHQQEVFEEAAEVFDALGVTCYGEDDAPELVHHVAELMTAAYGLIAPVAPEQTSTNAVYRF